MRLLMLFACLVAGHVYAEPPKEIAEYAAESRAARWASIVRLRDLLPKQSPEDRPRMEKQIDDLLQIEQPFYKLIAKVPAVEAGDIGKFLPDESWRTVQVIDATNSLIENVWHQEYVEERRRIGNQTVPIMGHRIARKMFWLSGVDTAGMEDGGGFEMPPGVYHVPRNHTYETAAGTTNTELVFEPLSIDGYSELFTREPELRTWTSEKGHKTEAVIDNYARRMVVLRNADNKVIRVGINSLSEADREFVMEWRKEYGDLRKKPKTD